MASTTHHAASSHKLGDQAAAAALYVSQTGSNKSPKPPTLDASGKLSSASAATSLKYAKAQDLPSFPSAGLKMSSAGAAASLADSNKKSFEHWKPGTIPAANKAALLAKDYEADPLWQPELSQAGSTAALRAHKDTTKIEPYRAPVTEEGHSAAGQALRTKPKPRDTAGDISADVHRKALMAATGAMASSRPRSESAPSKPVDTTSWALKAATKSHRDSPHGGAFASGDPGFEAARIQHLAKQNVNRQLYGSTPPVEIEVEEKNRQDTLKASAIAMAQKMYASQQGQIDDESGVSRHGSRAAAASTHRRNLSDTAGEAGATPQRYENLEEAARRLAKERLAKLHDEHSEYRQYYGAKQTSPRSRLSRRLGRRASTGDPDSSDEENSRQIRRQMSLFQSNLAAVDGKKRQADRDALLEIAHRNVEARMAKIDDRVFQETGKASPAQKEMWERQARERVKAQIEEASKNVGKVHIGGGKYLDQDEVDAIAKARLQPTFDDINDKAEKQRAHDEEVRLEQERIKRDAERDQAREAEVKAEIKAQQDQLKADEKARKDEEKKLHKEHAAAEKEKHRQEKEAEKERARLEKEEKRKSVKGPGRFSSILHRTSHSTDEPTDAPHGYSTVVATSNATANATVHDSVTIPTEESGRGSHEATSQAGNNDGPENTSPPHHKRDSRVKSWFKTHLKGSGKPGGEETTIQPSEADKTGDDSIRDVAMAGRTDTADPVSPVHDSPLVANDDVARSPSISSISSDENMARGTGNGPSSAERKSGGVSRLLKKIRPTKDSSDTGDSNKLTALSNGSDDFQEARDTFDEKDKGQSALPTPHHVVGDAAGSAGRPSSSHERSKFTEEL